MFSFFKKSKRYFPVQTDIHSHLVPGVDDGVKTSEESFDILRALQNQGYKKVITTPHIYQEVYPNTEEDLIRQFETLKQSMPVDINIDFRLAAEYYVDEFFIRKVRDGKKLLFFGEKNVLIETSFYVKPVMLENALFELSAAGYKPVLAHPERYQYIGAEIDLLQKYRQMGAFLQVNAGSLTGVYGKAPMKVAEYIVKNRMISFLGSDIHKKRHVKILEEAKKTKCLNRISSSTIRNDQIE